MNMTPVAITSPVFALVRSLELDVRFGGDSWTERIEIWQDTADTTHFRCRFWELEYMRLTPSFPHDEHGQPAHITDDRLLVDRGFTGQTVTRDPFHAADVDATVAIALADFKRFLEHVTGEPVQ